MATLAQLRSDALAIALSSDSTGATRYLNETRDEMVLHAKQSITITTATMTSAASNYDITAAPFSMSEPLALLQVTYSDPSNNYVSILDDAGMDWNLNAIQTVVTGIPSSYSLEGASRIYFDTTLPVGAQVVIRWVPAPTDLSSDSDTPSELPVWAHYIVADGAAAKLARVDSPELAMALQQRYEVGLDKLRAYANRRKGSHSPRIRVGYPSRSNRPRSADRSMYPEY